MTKKSLLEQIDKDETELREALQDAGNPKAPKGAVDWRIAFAEVFQGSEEEHGFDIFLANPPYVRQELLGREYKEKALKPVFPEVYTGTCDLYIYFYARAHQLLRQNGVACFISSNKWLRAAYGEKLRQHLLDSQAFHLVVDFGELPVFGVATFPAIFLWQKEPRGDTATSWAVVKDLEGCYNEGIREYVTRIGQTLPGSQFGTGKARLAVPAAADRRAKMEASGARLEELVNGKVFRGVVTGLNEAFIIDRVTRDRLMMDNSTCAEIIKPFLRGDDVRRYEFSFRDSYLIFLRHGANIRRYPSILKHLTHFRPDLTAKKLPTDEVGRKPGDYAWYEIQDAIAYFELFESTKILYPEIGKEARFVMDFDGHYPADTAHIISSNDWYLLGVLNSALAFEYLKGTCSVLGDEDKAGRLRFKPVYMETLPIPDASTRDREAVAGLAQEAQRLHTERRQRVEQFLRDLGTTPAESSSRNPLEQPWKLTPEEFTRRAHKHGTPDLRLFTTTRDETAALTEEIAKVEREIDERVAGLYGVELTESETR
ncbi:MAG: Eco57I restriction-modification methylase domain-containing protein [Armatimonadetes bacterium]|nr:Eco57I restriction-modification methylase domain-containing protein [Armatimonadota bacterium]